MLLNCKGKKALPKAFIVSCFTYKCVVTEHVKCTILYICTQTFCEEARAAISKTLKQRCLIVDSMIAVVPTNLAQLMSVGFGSINMILIDASNVSVQVL